MVLSSVPSVYREKQDYDFLSTIEILLMDRSGIFLMQN